jgi:hypothetical protein
MESEIVGSAHLDDFERMEKHYATGLTPARDMKENHNPVGSPNVDFGDFENNEYGTIMTIDSEMKESFKSTPMNDKKSAFGMS